MKVAVSGHRPGNLGKGWHDYQFHANVRKALHDYLDIVKPELLITGMALGVDQWAAQWCIRTKTPFIAAIPFKNQYLKWSPAAQAEYNRMLKVAFRVIHVDRQPSYIDRKIAPDLWCNEKMQTRNRWMVDQLDVRSNDKLVAVIDHNRHGSGTHNCIQYANERMKEGLIIEIPVEKIDGYTGTHVKDDDVPF